MNENHRIAVIFDLDGTLTKPHLNFEAIRREIGLPLESRTPILESIDLMSEPRRAQARGILERHEQEAARASELQEDTHKVLDMLRNMGIPIGLSTRNSRACTEIMLQQHGLRFHRVHTRDDGISKPSPEPILMMCREWNVTPGAAWVVGDYLFDLQAGRAAGSKTVLMVGDSPIPPFADLADHVITQLRELVQLIGGETNGD
jgi:HAD superfamily hydrolase (TIGR01549 family)